MEILKLLYIWGLWIVIPLIYEFFSTIMSGFFLIIKKIAKKNQKLEYYPMVTIIVPIYNSEKTLKACLESITYQTYPLEQIEVLVVNNGQYSYESHTIFSDIQHNYSELNVRFYESDAGKSLALNKGIFLSNGNYVINIDSDGWLDKNAIYNIVLKFETNYDISGVTGSVLIDPGLITSMPSNAIGKIARKCEYMEYIDAFLVGRNFTSSLNDMYTVAGAFSAFKKEALFKTQLYNGETLGEDTHMTFQIKKFDGGKIVLCEDAFFFVDPIENFGKMYTQRQRWQRSEIEVAAMFQEFYPSNVFKKIFSAPFKSMISDYSMGLLKSLWFLSTTFHFIRMGNFFDLIGFNVLLYLMYVTMSFVNTIVSMLFMKNMNVLKLYSLKNIYIVLFVPFYRFVLYWIRLAGIINCIDTEGKWKSATLKEELVILKNALFFKKHK